MADMKLYLELLARTAGFRSGMNESGRAVTRFTHTAKREFDALRSAMGTFQGKLAAIGLSFGAMQQLASSARLDKGLTQLRQTAGESAAAVKGLRKEFFEMGKETGAEIEGIKSGFDSLIQSGQSWKAAMESSKGINIAKAVTGSDERVLAGGLTVGAKQFNIDLEKPGKALEMLDKMVVAGRLGNAELENLSDIFARVGANANAAGMSFEKTLAIIEALSAGEMQPERLATLTDSTIRLFNNLRYAAAAQKATGVQFFDGSGKRRDPVEVLQDFKKKWDALKTDKSRAEFIQGAFGKADLDTIKGIRMLLDGTSLRDIRSSFEKISAAGGTLKRDMPDALNNAVDQAGRLRNTLRQAADDFARPINKTVANVIQKLTNPKDKGGMGLSGGELIAGGIGLTAAAYFGGRFAKGVAGRLLRGGSSLATGVAQGKMLESAAGVAPVFVTNWPADIGGGAAVGNAKSLLPALAAAGQASWMLAPATGAAVVGGTSIAIGNHLAKKEASWRSTQDLMDLRARQMVMGGGPNSSQVRTIDAELAKRQVKNDITLNVRIDSQGRVFTDTTDMNTRSRVNVKRGAFDGVVMSAGQP